MILVLAGTGESREIIGALKKYSYPVLASVVTDYGYDLLNSMGIKVIKQRLDREMMVAQIEKNKLAIIIDATHPFAREASLNALAACRQTGISYIRFERQGVEEIQAAVEADHPKKLLLAADFREAARIAADYQRILLTIGSKNLHYFTEEISDWQERLIIRILSDWPFVKRARELGFSPANIIAMQGPFSRQMNRLILKEYRINLLVCKDSGERGGLNSRLAAAEQLNIPVLLVKRPVLDYQLVVRSVPELLRALKVITEKNRAGGENN